MLDRHEEEAAHRDLVTGGAYVIALLTKGPHDSARTTRLFEQLSFRSALGSLADSMQPAGTCPRPCERDRVVREDKKVPVLIT